MCPSYNCVSSESPFPYSSESCDWCEFGRRACRWVLDSWGGNRRRIRPIRVACEMTILKGASAREIRAQPTNSGARRSRD